MVCSDYVDCGTAVGIISTLYNLSFKIIQITPNQANLPNNASIWISFGRNSYIVKVND